VLHSPGEALHWLEAALARTASDGENPLSYEAMALAGWSALSVGSAEIGKEWLHQCRSSTEPSPPPALLFAEGILKFFSQGDPSSVDLLSEAANAFTRAGEQYKGDAFRATLMATMAAACFDR